MTATPTEAATSLSARMREGSAAEHRDAESSAFMEALLAGRVSGEGYAHYLAMLRRVYGAIEATADLLRDDPLASAVIDPALSRVAALDADLAFWGDADSWRNLVSPAAEAYAERAAASAQWGGLFVAHHYTRYLGDLSGGQVIGRLLTREFGLGPGGDGVAFYAFPDVPKPKPYKDTYRARLDALALNEAQSTRVVEEVKAVFGLNGALFAELGEHLEAYRRR